MLDARAAGGAARGVAKNLDFVRFVVSGGCRICIRAGPRGHCRSGEHIYIRFVFRVVSRVHAYACNNEGESLYARLVCGFDLCFFHNAHLRGG